MRAIGLLLAAASLYVIVRVYRPGSGKATGPEPIRPLLPVLVVILAIGVLAIYPEELLDIDKRSGWKSVLPVDLVRSVLRVLAVCLVLSVLSRLRGGGFFRRGGYFRTHVPELSIIAPVVLSLFWNNVTTNERMWLPSEVITVTAASSLKQSVPPDLDFPDKDVSHPVIRWKGDTLIIVAYVLASDAQSLTVTTPAGGIYLLPNDSNVTRQVCQDIAEPHADQALDAPLLFRWIPGQPTQTSSTQTPICKDLIAPS